MINVEAFNKVAREARLIPAYFDIGGCDVTREMSPEKPLNSAHELDVNRLGEDELKLVFHIGDFGEKHEVVNVESKHERDWRRGVRFIEWITDVSGIDAGIVWVRSKPHGVEDLVDFIIPVTRSATKTVESFLE